MKDYEAYLFDWDGTLARTVEIWLEEIKKNFYAHGIEISDADNARHFGDLNAATLFGMPKEKIPEFTRQNQAAAIARLPDAELYDDCLEVLRALRQSGKKIALVTTSVPATLNLVLKKHALENYFDAVVDSSQTKNLKPDPEGIRLALSRLNIEPKRAVMIGDNDKDLAAAANAGTDSVLFYPASHHLIYDLAELQKLHPTYTIRSWKEALHQLQ